MKTKRIISFILALVLCLPLIPKPAQVQAAQGGKLVALTFDDGPHRTYTKQLLDGLRQHGVHVTFFMIGSNAASNISLVQTAYDDGHQIGNHTYNHPNLNTLGYGGVKNELNSTAAVLDRVCGVGTDYLVRPPYGNANASVLSALGSPAVNWSVDTNDWQYKNADHVYSHIVNNASDGAIILCHDIYSSTVAGALRAVDTLLARGYEFVTVGELYRRRGVTLQDGVKLYSCKNNGMDLGPVEKPVISYEPVSNGTLVTIHSPSGAPVYYNFDGARFNGNSTRYTGSFVVRSPQKIWAVAAFDLNGGKSEVTEKTVFTLGCATPQIEIQNGLATIRCVTKGAPIQYFIEGATTTGGFVPYTAPVAIQPNSNLHVVCGGGQYLTKSAVRHYSVEGNVFADVFPGDWYYEAIDQMASLGILQGVGDDAYQPDVATTRGMLVTMLYRYSGEPLEDSWTRTNTFSDVEDGQWYSEAIEWAYRNEMVVGYHDNTFRHDQAVTREEMAKIVAAFISNGDYGLEEGTIDCRNEFPDGAYIQDWAVPGVNVLVAAGLMKGNSDGSFMPAKSAARAEVAMVLMRLDALI